MNFYFDLVKTFFKKYFGKALLVIMIVSILILNIYHIFFQDLKLNNSCTNNINEKIALNDDTKDDMANDDNLTIEEKTSKELKYYVDIKGAVKNPGVYQMGVDNIVNDCIKLAGGLLKNADTTTINLSKKITSEMVIYVPKKDEVVKSTTTTTITETNKIPNDASISDNNKPASKDNSSTQTSNKTLVNINTATIQELTTLSGVGEAKAQDIIEYRSTNGNFKTVEDIKNVSGIGEALFAKIKDYITV